jgi:hypothetical protein
MAHEPKNRIVVGDSISSANLASGLNRAVPAGKPEQRTLTSANLQAGLSKPAATPAPAAASQAAPTPSDPKTNK